MSNDGARRNEPTRQLDISYLDTTSRRSFIKTALAAAAAAHLPLWTGQLYADPPSLRPPLILYDGRGEFAWIGKLHLRMLANLLGRFLPLHARRNNVIQKRVEDYRPGEINRHPVTFYIGNTYGNPLPQAFKDDVMSSQKPVVWLNYNLQQIAWVNEGSAGNPAFIQRFGFAFLQNVTGSFDNVVYKGESYTKYQDIDLGGTMGSEIGLTNVFPGTAADVRAWIGPVGNENWPYIVRGANNLWYVADLPFTFMSEEDRYLVFADLLFEMLGVDYIPTKQALVRIEDVSAMTSPTELMNVADFFEDVNVPFTVAVIPHYRDPHGVFSNGSPVTAPLHRSPEVVEALHYMVDRGGELVMHGLTHQLWRMANPYNSASAWDYEFFRVTENPDDKTLNYLGPLRVDSRRWVNSRLNRGKRIFNRAGLEPIAFETPHYASSELDSKIFAREFRLNYHRALYFVHHTKDCKPPGGTEKGMGNTRDLKWAGQFFPYPIVRDVYQQKLLPENLGALNPEAWPYPELGPHPQRLPEDIIRAARKNAVLRDAWASFYANPTDIDLLKQTVLGIQDLGFKFVRASDVQV